MRPNSTHNRFFSIRTLIVILGILVALIIGLNSGLIRVSDASPSKDLTKNANLLVNDHVQDAGNHPSNLPFVLELSQDIHKLYKRIRN